MFKVPTLKVERWKLNVERLPILNVERRNIGPALLCIFLLCTLSPLLSSAATTTQPAVSVRDSDAQADTSIVIVNNGAIPAAGLPKNWTLDFNFGKSVKAIFLIDGKPPAHNQYWAPPYCPAGHNTPINLAAGPHDIAVTVNGQAIADFKFTITLAPTTTATTAPAPNPTTAPTTNAAAAGQVANPAVLGINAAGISDAMIDLSAHPQYLTFCKAAGITTLRVWTEGAFTTHQPAGYYHLLPPWGAAGVHVIAVANFQNSVPRCSAPSDADWTAWCSAIPPPATTGIWAIEIGNEVNTATYCTASAAQLAHLMQLAYPILHKQGYIVIAPSTLNSLNEIQTLQGLGAYQYADYLNVHSYRPTAAAVAADVDAAQAIATAVGKPLAMTEWGTRPGGAGAGGAAPVAWASQQTAAIALLKQRNVLACSFPLYVMPGDTLDLAAPFTAGGMVNQPFYGAMTGR
jgi:hypothetical protein